MFIFLVHIYIFTHTYIQNTYMFIYIYYINAQTATHNVLFFGRATRAWRAASTCVCVCVCVKTHT